MGGGLRQAKKRHPVVHHFNARRRYLVRLVPHPDIATAGNFLHELPPWTQMWGFTVRCKAPQMLRAFPITEQDGGAPEPLLTPEQPGLGIGGKMPHHRGHGRGYPRHLAHLPPSVGPHPDEEDGHCVAPDVRRKTSGKDLLCHVAPLLGNREFWVSIYCYSLGPREATPTRTPSPGTHPTPSPSARSPPSHRIHARSCPPAHQKRSCRRSGTEYRRCAGPGSSRWRSPPRHSACPRRRRPPQMAYRLPRRPRPKPFSASQNRPQSATKRAPGYP